MHLNNLKYRLSKLQNKPEAWFAGIVLITALVFMIFYMGGASVQKSAVVFPANENSLGPRDDRGGFAPGDAYENAGVGDSLGMVGGAGGYPAPAAEEKKEEDFISALNDIAEVPEQKEKKKRGFVASLKKALFDWGGASGGGSSASLAAPSSRELVKRRDTGPGRLNRVDGSRDYRSAYNDSGLATVGAVRHNERGDGLLAAAGEKASNVFRNLLPDALNDRRSEGGTSLAGGEADKAPSVPNDPEKVDGKELEKPVEDKKAPEPNKNSPMPSPSMGSPGSSDEKKGGDGGDENGGKRKSGMKTGVSKAGLAGDTQAQVRFTDALKEAGADPYAKSGSGMERPSYTGDIRMRQAGKDKQMVDDISAYEDDEVMKAVNNVKTLSGPETAPSTPKVMDGVDLKGYPTDNVVSSVNDGYGALGGATAAAEKYKTALENAADLVKRESDATRGLSGRILQHKDALKGGEGKLQQLGGSIGTQGTAWDGATDTAAKSAIAGQVQTAYIDPYGIGAGKLVQGSKEVSQASESRASEAQKSYKKVVTDLDNAARDYRTALTGVDTKVTFMQTKSNEMRNSTAGRGEAPDSTFNTMRGNYDAGLGDANASREKLRALQKRYDNAGEQLKNGGCAVVEALKKDCS